MVRAVVYGQTLAHREDSDFNDALQWLDNLVEQWSFFITAGLPGSTGEVREQSPEKIDLVQILGRQSAGAPHGVLQALAGWGTSRAPGTWCRRAHRRGLEH